MKKILIISANIGQGHISAATALKQALNHLYPGQHQIEIIDMMSLLSEKINYISQKTYNSLNRFAPPVTEFILEMWNNKWQMQLLNYVNFKLMTKKINNYIGNLKPDLVISTFPVWDYLLRKILKKNGINDRIISIVTDSIFIHNAWVFAKPDYQIVPNTDTAEAVIRLGMPYDKVLPLGFPIRLNFLSNINKQEFFHSLQLDPNRFTILYLPTSQKKNISKKLMAEMLKQQKDSNIIVITGRDEKIIKTIQTFAHHPNIKIIGWTDEMAKFIQTSDLVITKAGGATTMECIAMKKPMIITSMIARHELGNAEIIKRHQLGIVLPHSKKTLSQAITLIKDNYDTIQKNLEKCGSPQAALEIAKFINNLVSPSSPVT